MTLTQYYNLVDLQARMSLKADAANYFFGYIWWLLEPLILVVIFYVVFGVILKSRSEDFMVFLLIGNLPFVWFSKSVSQASNGLIANAGLIGRIDAPKSLFPMVIVQAGAYKQTTVFALLMAVLIVFDYQPEWAWLWLLPLVIVNYILIVGCAFLGAVLVCFMRDFSIFISLGMVGLMFTSGIFWNVRTLADPQMTDLIFAVNPIAFLLDAYRQVLMFGTPPDLIPLLRVASGSCLLLIAVLSFMRRKSKLLALKTLAA